jgi:hypothetical protein
MFKFPVSFPLSFDNVPVTRQEPQETLRLCFLVNGEAYWLETSYKLEVDKQYFIALSVKDGEQHLLVGNESGCQEIALGNMTIPESIWTKNFQLGHYLKENQAVGVFDELFIKGYAASENEMQSWFGNDAEFVDLQSPIDVARHPIFAGQGNVQISGEGVWGYNQGIKRAGLGTDGRFMFGSGAAVGDENGLRTYDNGVEQIVIGRNGRLMAGNGHVIADSSGLTINDGKLMIRNTAGDVIIDGTGTVLKVHATGIGYVANNSSLPISFASLGYKPAYLVYALTSSGVTAPFSRFAFDGNNIMEYLWSATIQGDNTLLVMNASGAAFSVKYYILREQAF